MVDRPTALAEVPGPNGANFVPYSPLVAYDAGSVGDGLQEVARAAGIIGLGGNDYFKVESYADEVAALAAAVDGDKLVYGRKAYDRTASLIIPPKSLILDLDGARFVMAANVPAIFARSGITGLFALSSDYDGSNVLNVTVPSGVLTDHFVIGGKGKIICNGGDPCNRNEGLRPARYRTAEWFVIHDIDNDNSQLILASPLRYTMSMDGQLTPPDPGNLAEVESYTVANNARVFMPVDASIGVLGGEIEYQDNRGGVWNTTAVDIQGWQGVHMDGMHVKNGYSQGVSSATYGGVYNNLRIENLSDFSVTGFSGNIGYGFNENGWYSLVTGLRGHKTRHLTSTGGSPVLLNETNEGLLFGWGRQVGSVFVNPVGGGQVSAVIDTHQGADDFSIIDAVVNGCESYGITLRGRNHKVIRPRINAERGILVFSEFQDGGLPDYPGLNGKDRPNLSSAYIESPTINCVREALNATAAEVGIGGRTNITVGAHDAVRALAGGLVDFIGGDHKIRVTGAAQASADEAYRGVLNATASTSVFGITGFQGVRVRPGANVTLDATAAADGSAMRLFSGATGCTMSVAGGMASALNNSFDLVHNGGTLAIDELADWSVTDTTATRETRSYFHTGPDGSVTGKGRVVALADDDVTFIDLPCDAGIFELAGYDNVVLGGLASALGVVVAFADPLSSTSERISLIPPGDTTYVEVLDNVVLTGTSGTDGKLCLSNHDNGNTPGASRIYINNRLGAAISFRWTLRGGDVQGS